MIRDRFTLRILATATLLLLLACGPTPEPGEPGARPAPPPPEAERVVGYTFMPYRRDFDMAMLSRLRAPAGFRVDVFATGIGNPRMIAVARDGGVYVTRPRTGDVVLLRDRDGDGRADEQSV